MREIKFKFWSKSENKMVGWMLPHTIPLQYTGLKDKDGKEIYEWDIVMYSRSNT